MSSKKEQILKLYADGMTNSVEIAAIVGCSRNLPLYYINYEHSRKEQNINQAKRRVKEHPYHKKIRAFKYNHYKKLKIITSKNRNSFNRMAYNKIHRFCLQSRSKNKNYMYKETKPDFTIQDIINKFGETPKCYLTGSEFDIYDIKSYSFDHIIPVTRGGTNTIDNLGICTRQVNLSKSDMTPDEYMNLCKKVLEYNGYKVSKE